MPSKKSASRVPRDIADLVQSLRGHVERLREFCIQAFQAGDETYLGEVAGKLRLLVYEQGRNTPLLLALMDTFGFNDPLPFDPPSGPYECSLREYLDENAWFGKLPTGDFAELSGKQYIALWAQQKGASHEDWELDEELVAVQNSGLVIMGLPVHAAQLRALAQTVLYAADRFLGSLTPDLIALKNAEARLQRNPQSLLDHFNRGVALARLGQYKEAAAAFDKVLGLDPQHERAREYREMTLQQAGQLVGSDEGQR